MSSKHRWFSGRMLACHAGGPGSIPGRCIETFSILASLSTVFQVFQGFLDNWHNNVSLAYILQNNTIIRSAGTRAPRGSRTVNIVFTLQSSLHRRYQNEATTIVSYPQSRVNKLFFSRRNWDSPTPSPAGECAPPPPMVLGGAAHSLARRGWKNPNSDEGT